MSVRRSTAAGNDLMYLLRWLHTLMVRFQCYVYIDHIEGKRNIAADGLSRLNVAEFRTVCPDASMEPLEYDPALIPPHFQWS